MQCWIISSTVFVYVKVCVTHKQTNKQKLLQVCGNEHYTNINIVLLIDQVGVYDFLSSKHLSTIVAAT